MTKINWNRADLKRVPRARKRQRAQAFKARHPGWCENCHQEIRVGTPLRYNSADQVVHANGCPAR